MSEIKGAKSNLSAIELLKLGDADRKQSVLNEFWPYVLGIPFGVSCACFINFQTRRPFYSGIWKHILIPAGLTGLLIAVQDRRAEYFAEKDAVYRDYVDLHPEDFRVPERKKIANVFEQWTPIR